MALAITLLSLFVFIPLAHAQTTSSSGFSATISPLPILLNAKPGETVSADLRFNNSGSQTEKIKVVVKTVTQDGPNGNVTLHDPTPEDDFVKWISFSPQTFDAPPGEWQTIKMTVNVPNTAAFGYYFAAEFTNASEPNTSLTTNGTKIQGAVASFVLLNVNVPGEKRQMEVTSFTADHKIYEFLPVNFTIHLHNSGNVYGTAAGNIFIKRGSKQVAVLNVNENKGLVLPGSNRVFTESWNDGFPVYKPVTDATGQPVKDNNGQPKQTLSWNFSQAAKLRFGHYTADLALIYNDGTRDVPITGQVSFWVVPWRVIIFVILIIVGPAVLVYLIMRRRFNKRLEKEKKKAKHEAAK